MFPLKISVCNGVKNSRVSFKNVYELLHSKALTNSTFCKKISFNTWKWYYHISVGEEHRTHRTFPMARPKCLMGDFTNLYGIFQPIRQMSDEPFKFFAYTVTVSHVEYQRYPFEIPCNISYISDHFPIFYIDYSSKIKIPVKYVKKRVYSPQNIQKLIDACDNHDWSKVLTCDGAQEAFTLYHNDFITMYNDCFPVKNIKLAYKNRKPWLTEGLRKSIKNKNKLYRLKMKSNSEEATTKYNVYRNKLHSILRTAEREHFDQLLCNYKNNLKKTWMVIKDLINKKKSSKASSRFYIDNICTTNKQTIADRFNSYFVNIGPTLANKIPEIKKSPLDNMGPRNSNSIFIAPVVENEVHSLILNLKSNSPGWDSVSATIIKSAERTILKPLTHVLNLSVTTGTFPSEMKIARVIPLLKTGDPMVLTNYRPVFVLPVFSKVLERLMYNRLTSFVNKYKLLYSYQFGFRERYSTSLAMIYLVDRISQALDDGDYVLGLYLDFTKAFDTVNHQILLQKLEHYGIRGIGLEWFGSYLSHREQYVDFDGTKSKTNRVKCGVPQGSILGPLLFLLYINDLSNVSSFLFSLLFADDSNMFALGKDPNELIHSTNEEIKKISNWLDINKLTLNVKKTHFMVFRNSRRKLKMQETLMIRGHEIEKVDSTKFLGVYLDSGLTWRNHINYIKGKIARGIGILCKARKYLQESTLITLYYSFVYPYLCYCIEVWGNTYKNYTEPLLRLQKRVLRIITGARKYSHATPLFNDLKILRLEQLHYIAVQMFMYKFYHKILPDIFSNFFKLNSEIHSYNTRQQLDYHAPGARLTQTMRNIRYTGVKTHAVMSNTVSYCCSFSTYKKSITNIVLSYGKVNCLRISQ